jgi:hypothetical protein
MASNSFALRFKMLGDASGLTKATRKGAKDLGALGNASNKLNGVLKSAFVGFSLAGVTNQLFQFAKQASEDVQGSRLLQQSLENNVKGGAKFSGQVEELVSRLSVMAAVTDDEIRPAFGYLVRSTKSVEKSSKLMSVALDLAAGSGVSVQAAASALGRAYNGNLTALNKLVPGVKKLKDPLAEVEKRFKGMAKIQGDNDPFMQMTILADEAKEEIGKVLLPEIKKFATYMQTAEGKKLIEDVVTSIKDLVREGIKLGKWVIDNKQTFIVFGTVLAGLKVTQATITGYQTLLTVWQGLAKASKLITAPNVGGVGLPQGPVKPGGKAPTAAKPTGGAKGTFGVGAPTVVAAAGAAAVAVYGSTMVDLFNTDRKLFANEVKKQVARAKAYSPGGIYSATDLLVGGASGVQRGAPVNPGAGGGNMSNVTYKVVIENNNNTKITGREIVEAIKAEARRRGQTSGVWNLGSL